MTASNNTINFRSNIKIIKTTFSMALIVWKSYKASIIMWVVISVMFAMFPIFLGRAIGGANYKLYFAENGGGSHPEAFLLLGTNCWSLLSFALWDYATYVREEQQQRTLESLFLTPVNQVYVVIGRGLLSGVMAIGTFLIGTFISLIIFDPTLLESTDLILFLISIFLIFIGFIPLLGISLALGAFIITFKETNNVISIFQFLLGTLMGVFFPITILPVVIQIFSTLFPGTWITQDIRYIVTGSPPMLTILGMNAIFGDNPILFDFIAILLLAVFWTILGVFIFKRTLLKMEKGEGISTY